MMQNFKNSVEIYGLNTSDASSCGNPHDDWKFEVEMSGELDARGFVYDAENVRKAVDNTDERKVGGRLHYREGSCEQILQGFAYEFLRLEKLINGDKLTEDKTYSIRFKLALLDDSKETSFVIWDGGELPREMQYGTRGAKKTTSTSTEHSIRSRDYDYTPSKC